MDKIAFCFAKPRSKWAIGSYILRWACGTKFSHCAIYIDGFMYESVWPKSRKIYFTEWDKKYSLEFWYPILLNENRVSLIKQDLEEMVEEDRGYSVFQLFVIGLGFVNASLNKFLSRIHWNGKEHQICTELMADIMQNHFNYDFKQNLDNISLQEAFEAAKNIYWKEGGE